MNGVKVGVLALQGAFREHIESLQAVGATCVEVRRPEHVSGVDALVLPGGESTTITKLLVSSGLFDAVQDVVCVGAPVLGTCAGMIVAATEVLDGAEGLPSLGLIDVAVRRNAYGRQRESFEAPLTISGIAGGPFPGVFIRAPVIERVGAGVEVLASFEGRPVLARKGRVAVSTFHPELSGDLRLHRWFLSEVV